MAYTILDNSEVVLGKLVKIGAVLGNSSIETYYYLQFIPQVIFIGIWAYIVFNLLKDFKGDLNFSFSKKRQLAIRLGLLAIGLYILNIILTLQAEVLIYTYMEQPIILSKDETRTSGMIMAILGLVKLY